MTDSRSIGCPTCQLEFGRGFPFGSGFWRCAVVVNVTTSNYSLPNCLTCRSLRIEKGFYREMGHPIAPSPRTHTIRSLEHMINPTKPSLIPACGKCPCSRLRSHSKTHFLVLGYKPPEPASHQWWFEASPMDLHVNKATSFSNPFLACPGRYKYRSFEILHNNISGPKAGTIERIMTIGLMIAQRTRA